MMPAHDACLLCLVDFARLHLQTLSVSLGGVFPALPHLLDPLVGDAVEVVAHRKHPFRLGMLQRSLELAAQHCARGGGAVHFMPGLFPELPLTVMLVGKKAGRCGAVVCWECSLQSIAL